VALTEGRLDAARAAALRSIELQAKQDSGPGFLATLELIDGHPAAALAAADLGSDEVFKLQYRALALHDLGRQAEAQGALDLLIAQHAHDGAFNIASVYAWRGEAGRAFEWLERALALRDGAILDLRFDPVLRKLHGDPRFQRLLERMNFPAE
jgi:tetratricopeptide (TPR) repeat protein